jgi:hypothetical protein
MKKQEAGRHVGQTQARHLRRISARRRALRVRMAIETMPRPSLRTEHKAKQRAVMLEAIAEERKVEAERQRKLRGLLAS